MGESRSIVEGFYDAFNRGDFDAARRYVADDIENTDPTGTLRGWDAFRQYIETFKAASPDATLSGSRWIEDGNVVASEGTFTGTFTGPLRSPAGELQPTGRPFELSFAEFNQIQDGVIKVHRVYYDQMTFLAALGSMPASGGPLAGS